MGDTAGSEASDEEDPDRFSQSEAVRFIARRLLIFSVPLVIVGVIMVQLGLPSWVAIVVVVLALAIVVFEVDL